MIFQLATFFSCLLVVTQGTRLLKHKLSDVFSMHNGIFKYRPDLSMSKILRPVQTRISRTPMIYSEESTHGVVTRRMVFSVRMCLQDTVICTTIFNITNIQTTIPGAFTNEELESLHPTRFERYDDLLFRFKNVRRIFLNGTWTDTINKINGFDTVYYVTSTCETMAVYPPVASGTNPTGDPYVFQLSSQKYPLLMTKPGYVDPCRELDSNRLKIYTYYNGNFYRTNSAGFTIRRILRPLRAPALSRDPVLYFEESKNGTFDRVLVGVLSIRRNVYKIRFYSFSGSHQHIPGNFNTGTLLKLNRGAFRRVLSYEIVFNGLLDAHSISGEVTSESQFDNEVYFCDDLRQIQKNGLGAPYTVFFFTRAGCKFPVLGARSQNVLHCAASPFEG